jgi:hypothetical protein
LNLDLSVRRNVAVWRFESKGEPAVSRRTVADVEIEIPHGFLDTNAGEAFPSVKLTPAGNYIADAEVSNAILDGNTYEPPTFTISRISMLQFLCVSESVYAFASP